MRRLLSVIMFLVLGFTVSFAGPRDKDRSFDNGTSVTNFNKINPQVFLNSAALDTTRRVPGMTSWWDYWTNGQNQRMLSVLGDTVIVAVAYIDSTNAATSAGRVIYYQVSYDGGLTWLSEPVLLAALPLGGAYPDVVPVIIGGFRSIAITGRQFSSGSKGFGSSDAILGAGSFNSSLVPVVGSDFFSQWVSSTQVGGVYQTPDTVWFRKYDFTNNTWGNRVQVATPPTEIATTNGRKIIAASTSGQNITIFMYNALTAPDDKLVARNSTDGGTTWGAFQTALPSVLNVNGDAVTPWFGMDLTYKPNTNTYVAAFCTQPDAESPALGWKVMSWNPAVNGGNAVLIADWTNTPVLADSVFVNNSTCTTQVGMTGLSHPTLAYSTDGTRLYCVFSGIEKDSMNYGAENYFFNDLYSSYSTNDGATWSAPVKLALSRPHEDEIYPVLSKTGNTAGNFGLLYMYSGYPGSASFTNTNTTRSRNYSMYTRIDPTTGNILPIGINTISTEVPNGFSLKQNYPNPFNPATKIQFAIAKTSKINIKVYDVAGRLVEELVKGEIVSVGTHEVSFDASKLASGVYFYTLEADNFKETKKMMLVK